MPRTITPLRFATGIAAAILAAAIALSPVLGAHAAGAEDDLGRQTWAIVPASAEGPDGRPALEYLVEPGTSAIDHIAVRNFGTRPITVELYSHDASQSQDGTFDLLTSDEVPTAVGRWVSVETATVTVPARDFVVVPIDIDIPSDAEPGDHAGGVVAVNVVDSENGFSTQYRVGTRVYIRVGGAVHPQFDVDQLGGYFTSPLSPTGTGTLTLTATLVNSGNIRVHPDARATVTSLFGLWTERFELLGSTEILPDAAVTLASAFEDVPALGPLWVTIDVPSATSSGQELAGSVETRSATTVVWAVPWSLVVTAVLLAAAVVIAVVNMRRRTRSRATRGADEHVLGDGAAGEA